MTYLKYSLRTTKMQSHSSLLSLHSSPSQPPQSDHIVHTVLPIYFKLQSIVLRQCLGIDIPFDIPCWRFAGRFTSGRRDLHGRADDVGQGSQLIVPPAVIIFAEDLTRFGQAERSHKQASGVSLTRREAIVIVRVRLLCRANDSLLVIISAEAAATAQDLLALALDQLDCTGPGTR